MGFRAATVVATALGALCLLGCGDGETTTVTETQTAAGSTSSEAEAPESTTTDPQPGTDAEDGAAPPADRTVEELTGFTSPTGNIGCIIDRSSVRCDIDQRDWEPPPAPKGCRLDYGQGLALKAGGAADLVCAGDTTLGADEPLAYGQSIAAGLLRCESAESEISCRDVESGRGFTISRESYEVF